MSRAMWDPRARRFSLRVVYGLGCAAEGIKYNSMVYFLFFFYTQTIGLQPALCGLARISHKDTSKKPSSGA